MQFQPEFSDVCASTMNTSKKRFFIDTPSFGPPESYKWWRKVSATKTKAPSTGSLKKTPFPKTDISADLTSTMVFHKKMKKTPFSEEEDRVRVCSTLKIFREKCKEIMLSKNGGRRVDYIAKEELTKQRKICIPSSKIIGSVPGVNVGDRFRYRVELIIIGLHSRNEHGIDYMMYNGNSVATCIVAKEGYDDKMSDSEVITYVGEGGSYRDGNGCLHSKDQKLSNGNLALKNSIIAQSCVRVVRGFAFRGGLYVYDGLYRVVSCEKKRGVSMNLVFEFKLKRCPGQPAVSWNKFKNV